jgi:hypothetical protein
MMATVTAQLGISAAFQDEDDELDAPITGFARDKMESKDAT